MMKIRDYKRFFVYHSPQYPGLDLLVLVVDHARRQHHVRLRPGHVELRERKQRAALMRG